MDNIKDYNKQRLDTACARLESAIKSNRSVAISGNRITKKSATMYIVRRVK